MKSRLARMAAQHHATGKKGRFIARGGCEPSKTGKWPYRLPSPAQPATKKNGQIPILRAVICKKRAAPLKFSGYGKAALGYDSFRKER